MLSTSMHLKGFDNPFLQAVEVKEGLDPKAQDVTSASITYQTFFNLYRKLAGMTVSFAFYSCHHFREYVLDNVTCSFGCISGPP